MAGRRRERDCDHGMAVRHERHAARSPPVELGTFDAPGGPVSRRLPMAGVTVGGKAGKRRLLDSEINMIPMIDLLMVTISFLLITAVWVHAQRLEGTAQVPGPPGLPPCTDCEQDA